MLENLRLAERAKQTWHIDANGFGHALKNNLKRKDKWLNPLCSLDSKIRFFEQNKTILTVGGVSALIRLKGGVNMYRAEV